MNHRSIALALFAALGLITSAVAHDARLGDLSIVEPWARATIGQGKSGVAYMMIVNRGHAADRLIAVRTSVAQHAALHTHSMEGDIMRMHPVEAIEIDARASTVMKPSGLHIMLMGLHAPLVEGEHFPLTLEFETAGSIELQVAVMGATAMHGGHTDTAHGEESEEKQAHEMTMTSDPVCYVPVTVTDEAERKLGGALYAISKTEHGSHEGEAEEGHSHQGQAMENMEGAHMVHEPQHGGAFFMAPNKMHHLEALYSGACGFRLFLYNAFTEHIHVDRFQAFIRIIPEDEGMPEIIRILSRSEEGLMLQSPVSEEVSKPSVIELYVKFPESEAPELFTVHLPDTG